MIVAQCLVIRPEFNSRRKLPFASPFDILSQHLKLTGILYIITMCGICVAHVQQKKHPFRWSRANCTSVIVDGSDMLEVLVGWNLAH